MKTKYPAENGQQVALSVAPANDRRRAKQVPGRHYNISVNVIHPLKPDRKSIAEYRDVIIKFVGSAVREENPELTYLDLNAAKTNFMVSIAHQKQNGAKE
jgi:hypothetical protein